MEDTRVKQLYDFINENFDYGGMININGNKYRLPVGDHYAKNNKFYTYEYADNLEFKNTYADVEFWIKYWQCQTFEEMKIPNPIGSCWDQTEFAAHSLEIFGYKVKRYGFGKYMSDEQRYDYHTFVVFKSIDKWYYFENSLKELAGIHEYGSLEELQKQVACKMLNNKLGTYHVSKEKELNSYDLFEYPEPKIESNYNDFINNIKNNGKTIDMKDAIDLYRKKPKSIFETFKSKWL